MTLAGVNIANALQLFAPNSINASSQINGTITVNGPAAKPQQLTASAEFSAFTVTMKNVTLSSQGPIRASLKDGVASLDEFHVTGPGTDLQSSGTARVFGDTNPNGGEINVKASGGMSLSLIHTIDPDYITSGRVTLDLGVQGRVKQPSLTGTVKFDRANIAIDGIPNGLSDLSGTMVFNQNRLEVRDVSATSGGGKVTLGGFIAYQRGLFADLTANVDNVRVRLYGLSSTANASLRLQGGPQSLLLSGNVLVTRFGVGADVDFAAFTGTGGIPTPPDPNAFTNKIRLDVHVTSSPQLDFQNSYAKLAGTVDLNVRGTIAQPSILGSIRITDGSATFAGTKYELERGTIYFSNPVRIDPLIDLDVSTRVENYDITIGIHGDISNLKPTYRSSPPLTEADIFNLLALGRTQEEAQLNSQQEQQAGEDPTTSALLGGALNATVSSRVSKLFGAGSIKIDPAFVGTLGNSTARITVQEPLSKQLTLTFATNVNQSAEQLIQVQYQINENTAIVVTRDESGVFSIVYKIRKRYR
jgi:translocation and assembly module TamB